MPGLPPFAAISGEAKRQKIRKEKGIRFGDKVGGLDGLKKKTFTGALSHAIRLLHLATNRSQKNFNTITQHGYEKVLLEKGSLEHFI